jgi:hypothetical protein
LHRFHGTSIIFEASRGLTLGPSTFATACTIFHRFFHSASLKDYDVWSVALASTLLATKVEEEVRSLKQIIEEYTNVYARRLVLADLSIVENETETTDDKAKHDRPFTTETVLSSEHVACLREPIARWATSEQRRTICADRLPQQLNKLGPVYKEWYDQITKMESILLRQLGFIFYWIADSHPHKFILDFCRVLELDNKPVSFANRLPRQQNTMNRMVEGKRKSSSGRLILFVKTFSIFYLYLISHELDCNLP